MNTAKKTSHIAGLFWFLMALAGGFSMFYLRNYVIVPTDTTATIANITSSEILYRVSIVSGLFGHIFLFFFGLTLFHLFKEIDRWLANVLLASMIMAAGIGVVNTFNHLGVLVILGRPEYLKVFTDEQLNGMVMFLLRQANSSGQGLIEIFWTPYYFSLGLLIIRSRYLPKILGILLMIAGFGFAVNLLDKYLAPQFYPAVFTQLAMILSALSVLPAMFWLLIRGADIKEG
jgi:Domain of unknown function (DUF4386)